MTVLAAFPFIEVRIDTSGLTPVAQRSPGVIAIVGKTPAGPSGGTAVPDTPLVVSTADDTVNLFAEKVGSTVNDTQLSRSLKLALLQDPAPSKIYGVRVGSDYAAALAALEGVDDVTFVALAEEYDVGGAGPPATNLLALKAHVEAMSAQGLKRIGVAAVDPSTAKSPTYPADVDATMTPLRSTVSRMILVAARGASATTDVASAAMAAIAGFEPQVSVVLKKIRGLAMPLASQFSPSEIKLLSEAGINPIIDPSLIEGTSLHFADGRTYTTDADLLFIDIVRVLDDIEFRLKAGLIGMVGDARITKSGLTRVKLRVEGILEPLVTRAVIDAFDVTIPLLDILSLPESTRTAGENADVATARANRSVEMLITVTYGPAVHRLLVTLAPKF
jgi:hypothetical protein